MKNLAFVIASFAVTILCWGIYGPVLHWGQHGMSTTGAFALPHRSSAWASRTLASAWLCRRCCCNPR